MPSDAKHPLFGRRTPTTGREQAGLDEPSGPTRTPEDVRRIRDQLEVARKYVAEAESKGQDYAYFQSAQAANRELKKARKALDNALRAM